MVYQKISKSASSIAQNSEKVASPAPRLISPLQTPIAHFHEFTQIPVYSPTIQAKLTIGSPNDRYEQEADRVAAQVVQQLHHPASIQRQDELDETIQAKSMLQRPDAIAMGDASAALSGAIDRQRGGGQALDTGLQQSMGRAMGADFSQVRVHTDEGSDRLNRSIQAKAFTTGNDVFFRQGEYDPGSRGGQELIAHELTHVVQQNRGSIHRTLIQRKFQIGSTTYSTFKKFEDSDEYESILNWLKTQTNTFSKQERKNAYDTTLKQYVSNEDVEAFYSVEHFKQNLVYDLMHGTWTKGNNDNATLRYMTRRGWKNAVTNKGTDTHAKQSISLYRTMPLAEAKAIMIDKNINALSGHLGDYAAALNYCHRATNNRVLVEFKLKSGMHQSLFTPKNMAIVAGGTTTTHIRNRHETEQSQFQVATSGEGLHDSKIGVKSEEHGVAGFSFAAHGQVAKDVLKPMLESIRPLLLGKEDEAPKSISKSDFVRIYAD